MCNPVVIGLAISAVTSIASYQADKRASRKMNEALDADRDAQARAEIEQSADVAARSRDEMSERAREAMIERGKLRAISAESGLGGISQERLIQESLFNEGQDIASIASNRDSAQREIARNGRINSTQREITRAGIKRPNALQAGLQIAGDAAAYSVKPKARSASTIDS
jgi:hypothetical protein